MEKAHNHKKLSKFLSLVLRHKPEVIGLELDQNGWANIPELLSKMNLFGKQIDFGTLEAIVVSNDKKRFSFNSDKSMIRANQGHSLALDLGFKAKVPPVILYHGTGSKYVDSIYQLGLKKMGRHHVHLSKDIVTAKSVGQRHGVPVVFKIMTKEMSDAGFEFYESENGVWLTDEVPVSYLRKIEE